MSNQLKQTAELKGIKGNEKMLLEINNFKTIYQAKKESHMNAPQIYEYLFNEYNDNARKQNAIVVKQVADKKAKESIKKAEKIVKVKEEQKKIKKEIKKEKNMKAKHVMSFTDLENQIVKWNVKNNKSNKHFVIKIRSAITGTTHTFKFNHVSHFANWYKKAQEEMMTLSSESWGNVLVKNGENYLD